MHHRFAVLIALVACSHPKPAPQSPAPAPTAEAAAPTAAPASSEAPAPAEPAAKPLSGQLDRASISTAINAVMPDVKACGTKSTAKGMVKVKVTVEPSGAATVALVSSPDPALGACVVKAVEGATYPAATDKTEFNYPFIF